MAAAASSAAAARAAPPRAAASAAGASAATPPPVRRGPGRPRKTPAAPQARKGVVEMPRDVQNLFECESDNPAFFKAVVLYVRNLQGEFLEFSCAPSGMVMEAEALDKRIGVNCFFAGAEALSYYCERPLGFRLRRERVDKIFAAFDKSVTQVSLSISSQASGDLTLAVYHEPLQMRHVYTLSVEACQPRPLVRGGNEELASYALRWSLPTASLKKLVSTVALHSTTLLVQKERGSAPPSLNYTNEGMTASSGVEAAGGQQQVQHEGRAVAVLWRVADIRAFCQAMVASEQVTIHVDTNSRPTVLVCAVEGVPVHSSISPSSAS